MKLLTKLFITALFLIAPQLQAVQLKEGQNYEVIADKKTAKKQVEEVFSFWCPGCYGFEPVVKKLKEKLPKDIKFSRIHANFLGATSPQIQEYGTRAMLIGKALKKDEVYTAAIFNYIHKQRARPSSMDDFRNIAVVNGIDGDKFDKMNKSFGINSLFKKNQKILQQYRGKVSSVPSFVVNGRYLANMRGLRSADEMVELIVALSELP